MAYEKFIKKDGKTYGPYIYHSKRIDGKVVSEYHGSRKIDYKKFFLLAFGVLLLAIFIYLLGFSDKGITGNAILDLNANYQKNQPLEGKLRLSLQEGELIPASSKLVLENNGKTFQYDLMDLIPDEKTSGNFYVAGTQVSGSGEGYGIPGKKKTYPNVYFTLSVLSEQNLPEESSGQLQESTQETPEQQEQTQKTTQEETSTETSTEPIENTPAPITGNAIARIFGSFGFTATGNAVAEFENEVQGEVSADEEYKYTLSEGQRAEIKPRSVKTGSKQLNDNDVELKIEGGEAIVTTSYSEDDSGFGSDYLGTDKKELTIDLSKLNLVFEEGDLKVSIVDQGQELMFLTTTAQEEGEIVAEKIIPETEKSSITNQTEESETNVTFIPPLEILELTPEERSVLTNEFGNFSVEAKEAMLKNGFITIRHELGNYWVEHSYDASLGNETLGLFMEHDKVKWLKDIARALSQEEEPEKNLEEFLGNVSVP